MSLDEGEVGWGVVDQRVNTVAAKFRFWFGVFALQYSFTVR